MRFTAATEEAAPDGSAREEPDAVDPEEVASTDTPVAEEIEQAA
jgi:hypothetical protein